MQIEMSGSGRDLVLLHGWGMNAGAWSAVQGSLAQSFRLHAVDLPGFGGSPYHGEEMDPVLKTLLSRLPARFALVGWSWGGQLALRLAELAPQRLEKLVLIATPPCFVQRPDWPHAVAGEVFAQFATGLEQDATAALRRFIALQAQGEAQARQVVRQLRAAVEAHGAPHLAALRAGLADLLQRDMRPAVQHCQAPALVLQGSDDALVTVAAAQWLAVNLPAAQLQLFAACGHAPFASRPEAFIQAVTEFLNE